jgi:PadR family transcriptional regulator PadR
MTTQLRKGVLDLCVLALLTNRDYYGYEMVHEISQIIEISEGTVYPILKRLTREGYLETYLKESRDGPSRKYYRITPEGRRRETEIRTEWLTFSESITNLLKMTDITR